MTGWNLQPVYNLIGLFYHADKPFVCSLSTLLDRNLRISPLHVDNFRSVHTDLHLHGIRCHENFHQVEDVGIRTPHFSFHCFFLLSVSKVLVFSAKTASFIIQQIPKFVNFFIIIFHNFTFIL